MQKQTHAHTHTPCWKIPQRWFSQRTKPPWLVQGFFICGRGKIRGRQTSGQPALHSFGGSAEGCEPWMLDPWSLTIKPAGAIPFSNIATICHKCRVPKPRYWVLCHVLHPFVNSPRLVQSREIYRNHRLLDIAAIVVKPALNKRPSSPEWSLNLYTYVYIFFLFIYLFMYYSWFIDI